MLQLYFYPMACSLASRIALMEAGIEARYRLAHIWNKKVLDDDSDFLDVSSKGAVPVLVLENGERLTETAAVLQYIADLRPESGLAPRPGDPDRYRLQEWLSFVGTEIHKAFLFPTFWYKDDASKAAARERIGRSVSVVAAHLARPGISRRRSLHCGGCASRLGAAAARPCRRRSRAMAAACRLSRPHPGAPTGQGRNRHRDGVAQDGGGLAASKPERSTNQLADSPGTRLRRAGVNNHPDAADEIIKRDIAHRRKHAAVARIVAVVAEHKEMAWRHPVDIGVVVEAIVDAVERLIADAVR